MSTQEDVSYYTNDEDDDDLEIPAPTAGTYSTFNEAFAHFNDTLFGGELPDVLITLQRRSRSKGFFAARRFAHRRGSEIIDEIALNPAAMQGRTDEQIASTLVHEMVHHWQEHFGKPGRGTYHNKEWAAKMEELGLIPSHTGEPGGKRTGQRVTHYIQEGGRFQEEWKLLAECGFAFDYHDRLTNGPTTVRKLKVRYACPVCSIHVWGKPELRFRCEDCNEHMR
jgi:predicted SprT family Zn-dependent metalloprotease